MKQKKSWFLADYYLLLESTSVFRLNHFLNRESILSKFRISSSSCFCPVGWGWGCRIHQLLLFRGVRHSDNVCSGYDIKRSDCEVLVMLELWGERNTPSLPSLLGPLCPRVVAPDNGPIYGLNRTKPWFETMFFAFKLCIYAKLNCLKRELF